MLLFCTTGGGPLASGIMARDVMVVLCFFESICSKSAFDRDLVKPRAIAECIDLQRIRMSWILKLKQLLLANSFLPVLVVK